MKIEHITVVKTSDIDFLTSNINDETKEFGAAYPFAFFIRNELEEIIAGCNGSVVFGSIYTDQLWVHSDYRKVGFARKLMNQVHELGRKVGCLSATTCTMSFQGAVEFYQKLGYIIDFERKGYAHGSSCIFLKKDL